MLCGIQHCCSRFQHCDSYVVCSSELLIRCERGYVEVIARVHPSNLAVCRGVAAVASCVVCVPWHHHLIHAVKARYCLGRLMCACPVHPASAKKSSLQSRTRRNVPIYASFAATHLRPHPLLHTPPRDDPRVLYWHSTISLSVCCSCQDVS